MEDKSRLVILKKVKHIWNKIRVNRLYDDRIRLFGGKESFSFGLK